MMHIVCCIKQVPDTAANIRIKRDGSGIETAGLEYIISPYCEFAIEQALILKEKFPGSQVTLISVGPDRVQEAIRTAYAMGVDHAIHVNDPALEHADGLGVAKVLAAVIKDLQCDLVLCGKQAVDDGAYQIGACLSELLNLPIVSSITTLTLEDEAGPVTVSREIEGSQEVYEVQLPALLTCEKGLCEPRYPTLPGIMKAKRKPIDTRDLAALGLNAAEAGAEAAQVRMTAYLAPPAKQGGKILEGEAQDVARQLVQMLHEEAKVI